MKAAIGYGALSYGTLAALAGVVVCALGIARRDDKLLRSARWYVAALASAAVIAAVVMEWALLTHDFSIAYVADNVALSTPFVFTVTALWGALEGSILLWALFLAGYLAVTAYRFRARAADPVVAWATLVGLLVALFFFSLMLFAANPFEPVSGTVPLDGAGPNPLLQNHILMAVHPPMLYLGYVGFTVPFSFAIAGLVTGRFGEGWLADVRRTTLVAWGFLSIGIILGGWWSYEVLGWGGFWAWDPVENASILPWLTGTAFLHSVMVQERRGMLRIWNISLVLATFSLTILGTFLTRSGVVNSVHAFSESEIGQWLLAFLGIIVVASIGLIAWRGDELRSPVRIDAPVSRESAFLANNLVFAGFAFVVLLGTVFPLLVEALQDRQLSVGEPYFDRMTMPLGLALLFLMAVAPALPWRTASEPVLRRRLLVPAWVGVGTVVVLVVLGVDELAQLLAFGLAAFAVAGIVRQVSVAIRARRRAGSESLPVAAVRTVASNTRLYGGLVVHLGVVCIAVAIAATSAYTIREEVRLGEGESAEVGGYTVTYLGSSVTESDRKVTLSADVAVERGGDELGVYAPSISSFSQMAIGTPSVRTGLTRDLYLTLVRTPNEDGRVTLGVAVNPLVLWLWIGGGLIAAGVVLALIPSRRATGPRHPQGPRADEVEPEVTSERAPDELEVVSAP